MLWPETIAISLIGKPTHTVVIMLTSNAFNIYIGIALRYKQSQLPHFFVKKCTTMDRDEECSIC